jgi:hypothetical protein
VPAPHSTVLFDVEDCKVYSLLTDDPGASPTYGPAVDVPGISEVGVEPNIVAAELKGDATVIATKARVDRFQFTLRYGMLDLDALAVMLGGAVADSGAGTDETATWTLAAPASLPYFKLAFRIVDVGDGLGSVNVELLKCKLTGGGLIGVQSDQFGQPQVQGQAIRINGTIAGEVGRMMAIRFNEQIKPL